jgi:hypothetical protein
MDAVLFFKKIIALFVEEHRIKSFDDKLLLNNSRLRSFEGYLGFSIIEGIFCMVLGMWVASNFFPKNFGFMGLIGFTSFFAPFFLNYLFVDILFEKRKKEKEELLSDVLLEASVFCDESSAVQAIKKLSEQDFVLLEDDFKRAYFEIKNGSSVEEALQRMKKLNKSKAISRVIDLFLQGYKSGARMSETFKETAEDLLETKAIIKERQAVMLVTKYTLILASALIVPAILGLIIGLVSGMNFNDMSELGLGLSVEERKALLESAVTGTTVYVFEYAGLSAFFLALQEGNKKNFWVYSLLLVPLAGIIFFTAKALN